ncbi:MAG: hypothetical protein HC896_06505 [Bacteroidales bacterium]|nr:hypothetical protein [Bacteroidales bacterium]
MAEVFNLKIETLKAEPLNDTRHQLIVLADRYNLPVLKTVASKNTKYVF